MPLTNAEAAILGLVAERPRHGYELEGLIRERGLREWTEIGFSSIYFLLARLEKKGLVERLPSSGGARARKPFAITATGRGALCERALEMIARPEPARAAVLVGIASWPLLDRIEARDALERRADSLRAEQERIAATRDAQLPLPAFVEALFDFALAQIEADLAWTQRTRSRLGE